MASMIEHAVAREIHVKMDEDPVFYQSLSDRLAAIIDDYRQDRITGAERLRNLHEVLEDAKHPEKRAKDIGVDEEVVPFYELLKVEAGEGIDLKSAASKIVEILKSHVVIDWLQKEDVKRTMRKEVKRELRSAEYPADKIQDMATALVELAERRYPK